MNRKTSQSAEGAAERPLRVLWIVPGFPLSESDSAYGFLEREARLLAEVGVDLTIVLEGEHAVPGPWRSLRLARPGSRRDKIRMLLWVLSRPSVVAPLVSTRRSDWYPGVWRLWGLDRAIRRERPDIVHSQFAEPLGTAGVAVAHALGVPVVCSLRGVDLISDEGLGYGYRLDARYEQRLRRSLGRVDRCLVATTEMRDLALEAGARPGAITVSPNPLPLLRGSSPKAKETFPGRSGPVAICIGSLDHRKGFEVAIEALTFNDELSLVVVGGGARLTELVQLADRLRVSDRVVFKGPLAFGEVEGLLGAADIFWSTAKQEAFGNVILEAAQAGLPLVCTKKGVAVDLVPTTPAAVFFDGSPSDLAQKTRGLLENSAGHPAGMLDRFNREEWRSRLLAVYREVMQA